MNSITKFFIRMGLLAFVIFSIQILATKYLFYEEIPFESSLVPRYWSHLDILIPIHCSPTPNSIQFTYKHYVTRNSQYVFDVPKTLQNYTWTNPQSGQITLITNQKNAVWFMYQPKEGFLGCDSFEIRLGTSTSAQYVLVQLNVVFGPSLTQGILNPPENFRIAQMTLYQTAQVFAELQKPSLKRHIVTQDLFLQTRFRTCALVGNGGVLKGRLHGTEIDGHEVVFRMNAPPVSKFKDDVGSKTNFMFSATRKSSLCWTFLDEAKLMKKPHTVFAQISDLSRFQKCALKFEKNYPNVQLNMISYEWMMLADEIIRGYVGDDRNDTESTLRSTGMLAFLAATISCDKLKVYGFRDNPEGYHHYWDNRPRQSGAWGRHNYTAEQQFYHDMAIENYVVFEKYLWPYNLTRDIVFVTS